jgi:hypothetical protein
MRAPLVKGIFLPGGLGPCAIELRLTGGPRRDGKSNARGAWLAGNAKRSETKRLNQLLSVLDLEGRHLMPYAPGAQDVPLGGAPHLSRRFDTPNGASTPDLTTGYPHQPASSRIRLACSRSARES